MLLPMPVIFMIYDSCFLGHPRPHLHLAFSCNWIDLLLSDISSVKNQIVVSHFLYKFTTRFKTGHLTCCLNTNGQMIACILFKVNPNVSYLSALKIQNVAKKCNGCKWVPHYTSPLHYLYLFSFPRPVSFITKALLILILLNTVCITVLITAPVIAFPV